MSRRSRSSSRLAVERSELVVADDLLGAPVIPNRHGFDPFGDLLHLFDQLLASGFPSFVLKALPEGHYDDLSQGLAGAISQGSCQAAGRLLTPGRLRRLTRHKAFGAGATPECAKVR